MPNHPLNSLYSQSSSSTPVRGIALFDSNAPDDLSTASGERYLRRGAIETDETKFDTAIWSKKGVIKTADIDTRLPSSRAYYGTYKDGANVYVVVHGGSLISRDDGQTWQYTTFSKSPALLGFSQNKYFTFSNDSTSGVIHWYDDASLTNITNRRLTTDSIRILITTPTTVVAAGVPHWKISTDAGSTWQAVSGQHDFDIHIYSSSAIVTYKTNTTSVHISTDNGRTFTEQTNAVVADTDVSLCFANNKFYLFGKEYVQESTDGVTWTNQHSVGKTAAASVGYHTSPCLFFNGAFVYTSSAGVHISTDDGQTWQALQGTFNSPALAVLNDKLMLFTTDFAATYEHIRFAGDDKIPTDSDLQNTQFVRIS